MRQRARCMSTPDGPFWPPAGSPVLCAFPGTNTQSPAPEDLDGPDGTWDPIRGISSIPTRHCRAIKRDVTVAFFSSQHHHPSFALFLNIVFPADVIWFAEPRPVSGF